jgi:predicted acylesterase/phospholipase RssA
MPGTDAPYQPDQFKAPGKVCDLVMKGGITSGIVYPHAILELAQEYRFRSIGGASAGAIAAAFAAAAEYGRQGGDPGAFVRLAQRCDQIPDILHGLFQPSRPLKPLMKAVEAWSQTRRWSRWLRAAAQFWPTILLGLVLGLIVIGAADALAAGSSGLRRGDAPGLVLAAAVGAVASLAVRIRHLVFRVLPAHNFGLCSGMADSGRPVLTDWIYRSLQFIAFGREDAPVPLTFGHLARLGMSGEALARGERNIDLRMMTTNLSMRRPHVLPGLGGEFYFRSAAWARLFPPGVGAYLEGRSVHAPERDVAPLEAENPDYRKAPEPDDWPVVVAVRMSLSFPVLIETVPMAARDLAPEAARSPLAEDAGPPKLPLKDVVFSDGGLSSNFPIHFFDALLPTRPTFALSLDPLQADDDPRERVSMPQTAAAGSFSPVLPVQGIFGFAQAVFGAAKDWQDQLLSTMPGQRERIVHIKLAKDEGGLNLAMPPEKSRTLMSYGTAAGTLIRSAFNFDEHRWRRTLVAYQQLQSNVEALDRVWPDYDQWLKAYGPEVQSYKRVTVRDLGSIRKRFRTVAATAPDGRPGVTGQDKFPRPSGRLRIVPDV